MTDGAPPATKSPFDSDMSASQGLGSPEMAGKGESELEPLTRRQSPMFTRAPFIIGQEMFERLAYYGGSSFTALAVLLQIISYLTGKLNIPNSQAAAIVNAWSGTCYVSSPLIGAYFADAHLGRYKVILWWSLVLYLPGLIGITLSAGIPELHPADGSTASTGQSAFFWIMMYLVAFGAGGIDSCVSSFGADQFNQDDPRQAALVPKFFNYFFASSNVGSAIASLVLVNIQENISWTLGFAIPAVAFFLAITVFLLGTPLYHRLPPGGSPFARIAKVLGGAIHHRKRERPASDAEYYETEGHDSIIVGQSKLDRSEGLACLDMAAVPARPEDGTSKTPATDKWLVTVTEVEETKTVLRLLPIALTLIMYNCCCAQMSTLFIIQGQGMDTNLGTLHLAPATLSVLDCFSVIIFVIVYDVAFAPAFKKLVGRPITLLERIGTGYIVAMLSMAVAGIVEYFRLKQINADGLQDVDPTAPGAPTMPMSIWVQVPQYVLVGISEVFSVVGSMELFYQQAPDAMRSTCSAIELLTVGIGSYVSSALVAIVGPFGWIADNVNQGHLDYFFYTLTVLMFLDFLAFLVCAKVYKYKQVTHATSDVQALDQGPELKAGMSLAPSTTNGAPTS